MTAQTHAYKMKIFMHKRMSLPLLSRLSSLVPSPPPSLSPSPSPSRCPPFISTSSKEGDGERGEGERGGEREREQGVAESLRLWQQGMAELEKVSGSGSTACVVLRKSQALAAGHAWF